MPPSLKIKKSNEGEKERRFRKEASGAGAWREKIVGLGAVCAEESWSEGKDVPIKKRFGLGMPFRWVRVDGLVYPVRGERYAEAMIMV